MCLPPCFPAGLATVHPGEGMVSAAERGCTVPLAIAGQPDHKAGHAKMVGGPGQGRARSMSAPLPRLFHPDGHLQRRPQSADGYGDADGSVVPKAPADPLAGGRTPLLIGTKVIVPPQCLPTRSKGAGVPHCFTPGHRGIARREDLPRDVLRIPWGCLAAFDIIVPARLAGLDVFVAILPGAFIIALRCLWDCHHPRRTRIPLGEVYVPAPTAVVFIHREV